MVLLQVRGLQDSLRAMFNPHFGSTFRSHNNPTYFSHNLFRSLTQFLRFKPKSQKTVESWSHSGFLTSIQAVSQICFNTVSNTLSTRGLTSSFVSCHYLSLSGGVFCPMSSRLGLFKGSHCLLTWKLASTTTFWSCNNNISVRWSHLHLCCCNVFYKLWLCIRWIVICHVRFNSQTIKSITDWGSTKTAQITPRISPSLFLVENGFLYSIWPSYHMKSYLNTQRCTWPPENLISQVAENRE